MTDSFLICRSCGVLSPLDGTDAALPADEAAERQLDSRRFRERHGAHGIEPAARRATPVVYDGPMWDPMVSQWFEVAAGNDVLVVHSSRSSIDEPRHCQLVPGSIAVNGPTLEIDEAYLRLALDRYFYPQVLATGKIDRFIVLVRSLIRTLPTDGVVTTFDDASDPDVGVAPCPIELAERVCRTASCVFDAWEMERLAAFVKANCREDGALALRVRRRSMVVGP